MDEFAGTVIADRYAVERELGRGGMATVWLARDLRHERRVAIKVLHPELAGAIGVDRFIREVRLAAGLQHPNIVPILDSGVLLQPDGTSLPWYAMAYLEGESLRTRLAREQQLPVDEAMGIATAVADALQAAHRQGIIHRDIKPDNIFLSGGQVYVIDFGIAKALIDTGGERLTSTGLAIGTPTYMSPEQASAGRVDARSDQYSLATVLYEMLTGEPPFSGPTAQAIMARRFAEPARPLRTVRPTVSAPAEQTVLKALERVPADRYADMTSFVAALRAERVAPPRSGRHLGWWIAAGAGLLVVAVTAWFVLPRHPVVSPEVQALYERGLRGYDRRTPAGIVDAIAAFEAAIARDSVYLPAWAGLANSYARALEREFTIPGLPRDSLLQLAVASVDRVLAADSGSAQAWLTQAIVLQQVDPTDDRPSLQAVRRSIALDSTNPRAWHTLARNLAETGDLAGAVAAWRRSVALNPKYTQGLGFLSQAGYWQRAYDSAAAWADSAIAVDPSYLFGRTLAGLTAVEQGDTARSVTEFDVARRLSTNVEVANALAGSALASARAGDSDAARALLRQADSIAAMYHPVPLHTAVYLAQGYAALGDADRATGWLARYQPRRNLHFQLHLRCDPPFDPIKGDRRFTALLTLPAPAPGEGC